MNQKNKEHFVQDYSNPNMSTLSSSSCICCCCILLLLLALLVFNSSQQGAKITYTSTS